MDRAYFRRLDSTADDPDELFEHFQTASTDGRQYRVLTDARHGVERGTVVVEDADAVVRGYPSIPRVLVLETGVPSFFGADATVVVEEKLDGYNVRVADVGGAVAFTRSGYVCPYTTSRVRELLDVASFFADHPESMLCAEVVGPETPYTTHDYDGVDTNAVRVFDVRDRETGSPLSVDERDDVCDEYGFPQPHRFGRWRAADAPGEIRDAIAGLDDEGREGVVVQSVDGASQVKYTTEAQHHGGLAYAFALPFEYGRDFVFSRVVREGFQAVEFDEDDDRLRERAHSLGESVLLPMVETIRDVADGERVGERHTVRGDPDAVGALLDHLLDQSLTLDVESDRRVDGDRVVTFLKVAESTESRIQYYLGGGTRDE